MPRSLVTTLLLFLIPRLWDRNERSAIMPLCSVSQCCLLKSADKSVEFQLLTNQVTSVIWQSMLKNSKHRHFILLGIKQNK